ncbi:hypothetical protein BJ741DRAFT_621928 [Chytriomyces cf. hyalinus JEL632]|nr:hypothetical protein BJ741DRAFT_621928 [Chytriomyces cf. hyalinus JEL632]
MRTPTITSISEKAAAQQRTKQSSGSLTSSRNNSSSDTSMEGNAGTPRITSPQMTLHKDGFYQRDPILLPADYPKASTVEAWVNASVPEPRIPNPAVGDPSFASKTVTGTLPQTRSSGTEPVLLRSVQTVVVRKPAEGNDGSGEDPSSKRRISWTRMEKARHNGHRPFESSNVSIAAATFGSLLAEDQSPSSSPLETFETGQLSIGAPSLNKPRSQESTRGEQQSTAASPISSGLNTSDFKLSTRQSVKQGRSSITNYQRHRPSPFGSTSGFLNAEGGGSSKMSAASVFVCEPSDGKYGVLQRVMTKSTHPEMQAIDVREIFSRISTARTNSSIYAENPKAFRSMNFQLFDLSDEVFQPPQTDAENRKRFIPAFSNLFDTTRFCVLSTEDSRNNLTDDFKAPDPPEGKDPSDFLSLALHYHENEKYDLSAYYLHKAAEDENGHPLGLYLLGLVRRHGWGIREDQNQAFLDILSSCERTLLTIPALYDLKQEQMRQEQLRQSRIAVTSTGTPNLGISMLSSFAPSAVSIRQHSVLGFSSYGSLLKGEYGYDEAMWILPLPLFEIAVSFHQGWGIPKSLPAAIYFYKAAAALGDVDSMYELGLIHMKRYHDKSWFKTFVRGELDPDKLEAGRWFRSAHSMGKKVVGESWMFKQKWGGTEP